jgi:DNA modification methylase
MLDRVRELRRVPARELLAHPANWRRHPPAQRAAFQRVLKAVGFAGAALAREDDAGRLVLIDGHLRADMDPDFEVPTLVVDVTEAEAEVLLATYDPIGALADTNAEQLVAVLGSITARDAEMATWLPALLREAMPILAGLEAPGISGRTDPDAAPPLPERAVSRPGDLWCLGDHRLFCGDATAAADVQALLAGEVPPLMVTDPPYGVDYDAAWRTKLDPIHRSTGRVRHDESGEWRGAYALFPGAVVYVWHAAPRAGDVVAGLSDAGFEFRAQIVWAKTHFVLSRGHYHWQHELCVYAVRRGAAANWRGDHTQTTLWTIGNRAIGGGLDGTETENVFTGHSTQKPVECMRRPILNHTAPGEAVFDPFLGSGTALIAAEATGRVARTLEIDPAYVDVAVRRWQEFTGRTAHLGDASGPAFDAVARTRAPADP